MMTGHNGAPTMATLTTTHCSMFARAHQRLGAAKAALAAADTTLANARDATLEAYGLQGGGGMGTQQLLAGECDVQEEARYQAELALVAAQAVHSALVARAARLGFSLGDLHAAVTLDAAAAA